MAMQSPRLALVDYRTGPFAVILQWYADVFGATIVSRSPALSVPTLWFAGGLGAIMAAYASARWAAIAGPGFGRAVA